MPDLLTINKQFSNFQLPEKLCQLCQLCWCICLVSTTSEFSQKKQMTNGEAVCESEFPPKMLLPSGKTKIEIKKKNPQFLMVNTIKMVKFGGCEVGSLLIPTRSDLVTSCSSGGSKIKRSRCHKYLTSLHDAQVVWGKWWEIFGRKWWEIFGIYQIPSLKLTIFAPENRLQSVSQKEMNRLPTIHFQGLC